LLIHFVYGAIGFESGGLSGPLYAPIWVIMPLRLTHCPILKVAEYYTAIACETPERLFIYFLPLAIIGYGHSSPILSVIADRGRYLAIFKILVGAFDILIVLCMCSEQKGGKKKE
jgi:hypothetical protein